MLSDEEKKAIEEQYKKGLVNLSNVIEPLINQFKTDYSLDIQQCRLIINYLLMERDFNEDYYDELDKEIEELKEYKHDAELTKVACCTAQNCEALNNCIKLERELQNADNKWENKIKVKIEELKFIADNGANAVRFAMTYDDEVERIKKQKYISAMIDILQSLLEKE